MVNFWCKLIKYDINRIHEVPHLWREAVKHKIINIAE